jgi:hypothetical protein
VLLFQIRRGEVRRMSEMKDDVVEQSGVVRVVTSDAPHRCLIRGEGINASSGEVKVSGLLGWGGTGDLSGVYRVLGGTFDQQ